MLCICSLPCIECDDTKCSPHTSIWLRARYRYVFTLILVDINFVITECSVHAYAMLQNICTWFSGSVHRLFGSDVVYIFTSVMKCSEQEMLITRIRIYLSGMFVTCSLFIMSDVVSIFTITSRRRSNEPVNHS